MVLQRVLSGERYDACACVCECVRVHPYYVRKGKNNRRLGRETKRERNKACVERERERPKEEKQIKLEQDHE